MPRILACGGGSLGHIVPIIAVCQALRNLSPSVQVSIACTERPEEAEYLRTTHIPFTPLPTPRRTLSFPQTFYRSTRAAQHLLQTFQPDAILSRGGAVSLPLCLAALRRNLPIILHESDAVMGLATRSTALWARNLTTGFPAENYPRMFRSRITVTGNPVRPEMTRGSREEGLRITRFSGERPILLVVGGSQGAQAINEIVIALLPELTKICDIIHITGPGKLQPNTYNLTPHHGYWLTEFTNETLPHLYAMTTLALSRAGATFLSELAANGIPSIITPLRGVAHDHQWHNAQFFARHDACLPIEQDDLPQKLVPQIQQLLHNPALQAELRENMRTLHHPDASRHIAEIILKSVA